MNKSDFNLIINSVIVDPKDWDIDFVGGEANLFVRGIRQQDIESIQLEMIMDEGK